MSPIAALRSLWRRLTGFGHRHVWLIDWIDTTHVRCWCGAHPTPTSAPSTGDPS